MRKSGFKRLRRHKAKRQARRRFIIFCEGKNTEPLYFTAVHDLVRDALIEIVHEKETGVPMTLAEAAAVRSRQLGLSKRSRRKLDSFEELDEIWIIFDEDDHPKIKEAIDLCSKHGVGVAHSIPCFELWLILHIEDFDKSVGRAEVQKHLESVHWAYSTKKEKKADCSGLVAGLADAERRAESQLRRRIEERSMDYNPSTTVFKLTRAIQEAAKKARGH